MEPGDILRTEQSQGSCVGADESVSPVPKELQSRGSTCQDTSHAGDNGSGRIVFLVFTCRCVCVCLHGTHGCATEDLSTGSGENLGVSTVSRENGGHGFKG